MVSSSASSTERARTDEELAEVGERLTAAMTASNMFKDVKVKVAASSSCQRLGLFATQNLKDNEVVLSVPYDDQIMLTAVRVETALRAGGYVGADYDAWTGDAGLLAVGLLCELAHASSSDNDACAGLVPAADRSPEVRRFMATWVHSLPNRHELSHPLCTWDEDAQELLQYSSTKKIYQQLDDAEEDAAWWEERVWSQHRDVFPATVDDDNGVARDCFTLEGFQWALATVYSRSVFVDGMLRLVPIADYANHGHSSKGAGRNDNTVTQEVTNGFFGTFGTSKGTQVRTAKGKGGGVSKNEEIFVSYGPKTPVDYLLEHGFVPDDTITTALTPPNKLQPPQRRLAEVAELTFEVVEDDAVDAFHEDKVDILEFDSPLANPTQSFDVTSVDDPDPSMVQFLRLVNLGGMDAFLLESIFRQEVWDFMAYPVSETNEEAVLKQVIRACHKALEDLADQEDSSVVLGIGSDGPRLSVEDIQASPALTCAVIRELEGRALRETIKFMEEEGEALDLKEYYQQRRLKDLGLDSEFSEDSDNPDVGWGQSRAPGGGELDW